MTANDDPMGWLDAGPLTELREKGVKVIQGGAHPIAVFLESESHS